MIIATAHLKSLSPLGQNAHIVVPRKDKEGPDDYEKRTWRDRGHYDDDGKAFIPPMAFKNCISEAAKFLSMQIPGKGKATYTKHFEAGILVTDGLFLGIHRDKVEGHWQHVPSDGRRGSGSRVMKCFPVYRKWEGDVRFYILDETITKDVFERHIKEAGSLIGIGWFRPRNNGFWGRFSAEVTAWEERNGSGA